MRAIATEQPSRVVGSIRRPHIVRTAIVMGVAALALSIGMDAAKAAGADEAKKIFNQRCTACHTFGRGVKVGPDLKGVTERRQRPWLLQFIRSSQKVIGSGDAVAAALFQQFKQQRMPDWTDLSEDQIGAILDWLAANGPEQRPIDERIAELASFTEVELGRDLFHGRTRLTGGGMACAGCHAVREDGEAVGGSFGPDLTGAYADYRDRALTLFLRRPCFRRMPESSMAGFLMPHESFALKAYLRKVALSDRPPPAPAAGAAVKPVEGAPPSGSGTRLASLLRVGTDAESEFLFLFFPYAAVLLLFAGLGVRHALAR